MRTRFSSLAARGQGGLLTAVEAVAVGVVASLAAALIDPSAVCAAPAERAVAQAAGSGPSKPELAWLRMSHLQGDSVLNQWSVPDGAWTGPSGTVRNGAAGGAEPVPADYDSQRSSVKLDGVDDYVSTATTVATDRSFTVMAWVKLDAVDRSQVVLSQGDGRVAGFYVKANPNGKWLFGMPRADAESAGWDTAEGPAAVAGRWLNLAGVYDAEAAQIRLYVNGVKVATATHTAAWAAGGAVQIGRGLWAGSPADHVAGNLGDVHIWQKAVPDLEVADFVVDTPTARRDRCEAAHWLHAGGPEVKAVASGALAGSVVDRREAVAAPIPGWGGPSQLAQARGRDDDAYRQAYSAQSGRYDAWKAVIAPYKYWGGEAGFDTPPAYGEEMYRFLLTRNDATFHSWFSYTEPQPDKPGLERALALAAELRAKGDGPEDWQVKQWSAGRVARFLRFGGFPMAAPATDSAEFRIEVESIKVGWAGCDTVDPDGGAVLDEVTATARHEWNTELAGQAGPRAEIVAAEIQTMKDVRAASAAMVEAQGQAWIAGQLLKWQNYWLAHSTDSDYPQPTEFARAKQDLVAARTRTAGQLLIAQRAAASAKAQADKVIAAQATAAGIAAANGTPLYRGLAYAQQSAQVAKASAAAARAAFKAVETTANAVKATDADGAALQALARTQQAALQAEFRRVSAQEAADQARAAAQSAKEQADQAAKMAGIARTDRATAANAEARAKAGAEDAREKRAVAEQEAGTASAARKRADDERAKASQSEYEAQRQQAAAASARAKADADAAVAHDKASDAEEAEARARRARDAVVAAEQHRDAMAARAAAAEAAADAADGTDAAGGARMAANAARADANEATTAAQNARASAADATAAAVAARAAATEATGAAQRSRAAADGATAAAATVHAAAMTAHWAAADAISAADVAAQNVKTAEEQAQKAATAATQARADATAARAAADTASAESARTAGAAYAASEAATAARDAAAGAIAAGNDAIAMGNPFQASNASAGLAVLVGQSAKTLAEQQAAAAKAKADEAARAAQAARDAANRADTDAKIAAEAAASAAADAASAAQSVTQARASAAAAATDAQAAQHSADTAASYDFQAQADAWSARNAATTAESDAQAARNAATDAERDAASARTAADTAEHDAAAARDAATRADKDATAAEQAAARAQTDAQQAQDTAARTEADANTEAMTLALDADGITGIQGLQAVAHVKDDATNGDCLGIFDKDLHYNLTHCRMHVVHHVHGTLIYQLRTCLDPNTRDCSSQYVTDYLGTQPVDLRHEQDVDVLIGPAAQQILAELVKNFIADYVNCLTLKKGEWKTACGWAVGSIAVPFGMAKAVRLVKAVRLAMYTGVGLEDALAALRLAEIDAITLANIETQVARQLEELEGAKPTVDGLRAQLAELLRRRMLGLDQAKNKFIRSEMETALRIESERGVRLTRSTGTAEDWFDQYGRSYDAVGNFPGQFFDAEWPNLQTQITTHVQKAQFVPVDVSQFTPVQIAKVRNFIAQFGSTVFIVGG